MKELETLAKEVWDAHPECQSQDWKKKADESKPNPNVLASLQVLAGVESALIATHNETYEINDIIDFRHTAIAVPYCDALFCDKGIAHKFTTKPLEFDKVYDTQIMSRPDDILKYLQTLG